MNVLIADDDRSFTQLLSTFLKAKGHSAVLAYDALQAVAAVMRTPPDVIVLDIMMPSGSGLHALRRLKASTKTNGIPVVVVSGSADPKMPQTVKSLGADEFFPKPLDFELLYKTLVKLVPGAAAQPGSLQQPGGEVGPALRERPAILDALRAELSRAQREAASVSLIMVGIDKFKRIGDVHGEEGAEMVFQATAQSIRLLLRPYDAVGRYDDGRFLIVLPGSSGTAAVKKAEALRAALSESVMKTPEGAIRLTLSLGVAATTQAKQTSLDLFLQAAEEALGRANQAGGDRVELASELTRYNKPEHS
jgi:diguanylate cyclase (GGDEF)-like protein